MYCNPIAVLSLSFGTLTTQAQALGALAKFLESLPDSSSTAAETEPLLKSLAVLPEVLT